ncbi:MAG TPA: hypothetical protein VK540_33500 [Polyangiaceae bacterium]|nr:hypothetical protein [Polyangiaceae bacterium]
MVARVDPFSRAFLAAGVAHGAVIATLLTSVPSADPPAPAVESQAAVIELIEIDVPSAGSVSDESPAASEAMTAGGLAPSFPRSRSASGRGARPVFRTDGQAPEDPVGLAGSARETAVRMGSAGEGAAEEPTLSLDELGLEGPNRLSLRTLREAHARATKPVASGGDVVESMRRLAQERDRTLGLGASGPVAMALETAAYRSNVTLDGQATFEVVIIDNVASAISLVASGSEKQGAWNEVGKIALAQLAGRRVRGPTGSRGVVLRIQVFSRAALPSGHDPGVEITVGPFVVQRGRGKRSARLEFLKGVGLTSVLDFPGTAARLPAPGAVVSLVTTDIDPVDLGAKDRQVVHTTTLDERPFD